MKPFSIVYFFIFTVFLFLLIGKEASSQKASFQEFEIPIETSLHQVLDSSFVVRTIYRFNDYVGHS